MNGKVLRRPEVAREILQLAIFIGRPNRPAGDRFIDAVFDAFDKLAELPGMGGPWDSGCPGLEDVRIWPIPGFPNHLIFYRPIAGGIEVIHVLHGARDYDRLFDESD